jgi:polyferredoxin
MKDKRLETILTIVTGLIVVFLVFKIKWILLIAVVIGLLGMFSVYLSNKITWAWLKLSEGMGWVMSKVILGAVFFLFLFPLALISRLFNKDRLKLKRADGSYFYERNHQYEKEDLVNTW